MAVDYYSILEVEKTASAADIKKAYRRLALKWHPDKNPDNQEEATKRFKEISEAYEVLADVLKRRRYDLSLSSAPASSFASSAPAGNYASFRERQRQQQQQNSSKDKKRRVYDQYGREGLQPNGVNNSAAGRHFRRSRYQDDLDGGAETFGFPHFVFRDPEDVFREFFGGRDPFEDLMDPFGLLGGRHHHHHHRHHRPTSNQLPRHHHSSQVVSNPLATLMSPFGGGLFGDPFAGFGFGGGSSMLMSSGFGGGGLFNHMDFSSLGGSGFGGGGGMTGTSMSTSFVNGKKVTTKKTFANGVETVKVYENDQLVRHTVNGEEQGMNGGGGTHQHNHHHHQNGLGGGIGGSGVYSSSSTYQMPTSNRPPSHHHVRHQYRRI